jgi:hypothetical protein
VQLVFKTGSTTPAAASPSTAASATPTDDDITANFGALLAGLQSAAVAKPADLTSVATPATTSSDSTTDSAPAAIASTAGYSFTQADQYSPVQMSVEVAGSNGSLSSKPDTAVTSEQLSLANAMGPLDPDITAAGGAINDIALIGPASYSVIGYQPRSSATDPLIPIYGPAPTSYT